MSSQDLSELAQDRTLQQRIADTTPVRVLAVPITTEDERMLRRWVEEFNRACPDERLAVDRDADLASVLMYAATAADAVLVGGLRSWRLRWRMRRLR
jgi:hypothetical protein